MSRNQLKTLQNLAVAESVEINTIGELGIFARTSIAKNALKRMIDANK